MVVNNTKHTVQFKHFVEVPRAECIIGTALDEYKKLKLYLMVNGEDAVYKRNGITDTWDKLEGENYTEIRKLLKDALLDKSIPRYSTDGRSVLN